MILLYFLFAELIYLFVKIILYFISSRYGKFSYDGFSAAGFNYNSKTDEFLSDENAWQKKFGYCHLYDVAAPFFRIIIDTEPIKFYYNNKNWLITFWKGQYGIVTGAEVGIYNTNEKKVNRKTMYLAPTSEELIDISFILNKKNEVISKVQSKRWWTASFKLGMFSWPKDLTMDISLTFPNGEMLEAFLNALRKKRYKEKDYRIKENTVSFTYKKPHTFKVFTRMLITDLITQRKNKKNVNLYNNYLEDIIDKNNIDDSVLKEDNVVLMNKIVPEILKNKKKNDEETEIL